MSKVLRLLPGLLLLLGVGYAGKIAAGYVPHTEYVLFAIAFGMLIRNCLPIPDVFLPGINTYEFWMKAGITLMGAKLALQSVLAVGVTGLGLVCVEILVALITAAYLARWFGLSERLGTLIGVGVGVCGVSAIIGTTGAIDAKEEDAGYAISTILLFGAVMVFTLPFLGHLLGLSDRLFGFWAGLSVDSTAETIATGFAYSEAAGKVATIVKLSRNALMGVVILLLALDYARRGMAREVKHKGRFVWERLPKFLLGFLLLSLLATFGFFSAAQVKAIDALSKWAFLLTFAGVGLATSFRKFKSGIKPFLVGFGVETVGVLVNLALIALTIRG